MHNDVAFDQVYATIERGRPRAGSYWGDAYHPLAGHGGRRFNRNDRLGFVTDIIGAAVGSVLPGSDFVPGGPTAPTGATTGFPQPGSTATTISPTIQNQANPQISPVFNFVQDSAGSTQASSPTQLIPGGQSGQGGSSSAGPGGSAPSLPPASFPSLPALPTSLPPADLTRLVENNSAGSLIRDIRGSAPFDATPWLIGGGILAAAVVGAKLLKKKR